MLIYAGLFEIGGFVLLGELDKLPGQFEKFFVQLDKLPVAPGPLPLHMLKY